MRFLGAERPPLSEKNSDFWHPAAARLLGDKGGRHNMLSGIYGQ